MMEVKSKKQIIFYTLVASIITIFLSFIITFLLCNIFNIKNIPSVVPIGVIVPAILAPLIFLIIFTQSFKLFFAYQNIKLLSRVDYLTKLYNRNYFEEMIQKQFENSKRYKLDLAVIIIDFDFFKRINDTYGHLAGDYVLSEVAKIINNQIRETDIIARYGGDEFILLTPNTTLFNCIVLAERIRKKVWNYNFIYNNEKINVTLSLGCAAYNNEISKSEELIQKADCALYQAKKQGRNKINFYKNIMNMETL